MTKAAESFGCLAVPGLFSLKRTFSEDSDSGAEIFRCSFNSFESFVSSGTFVFGCLFEAIGPDAADNAFFSLSFLGCERKSKHLQYRKYLYFCVLHILHPFSCLIIFSCHIIFFKLVFENFNNLRCLYGQRRDFAFHLTHAFF